MKIGDAGAAGACITSTCPDVDVAGKVHVSRFRKVRDNRTPWSTHVRRPLLKPGTPIFFFGTRSAICFAPIIKSGSADPL